MRQAVLADTGPLYAAVDPSDQHHQRAQQQIERLAAEERDVVVLFPTLFDAVLGVVRERIAVPVWTYDADFDVMGTAVWR